MGKTNKQISIFELNCWHHIHNVWFGAVTKQMSKTLQDVLADQLINIPLTLCIHNNIVALLCAIEKECSKSCNYDNGHEDHLHQYMRTYHPNEYFFACPWVCGGSRQDIGLEGCPVVYMNLHFLVHFFYDQLSVSDDNILQKVLFMMLQPFEIIMLLQVLSIFHISVCLQTHWLSGNVEDLAECDFGVLDMGDVIDTLNGAMEEVARDGKLMLNEDFVMNISSKFQKKIDPFDKCLTYILEEKLSDHIGGTTSVHNKVIPFNLLKAILFIKLGWKTGKPISFAVGWQNKSQA